MAGSANCRGDEDDLPLTRFDVKVLIQEEMRRHVSTAHTIENRDAVLLEINEHLRGILAILRKGA